jgi:hypothetical protein
MVHVEYTDAMYDVDNSTLLARSSFLLLPIPGPSWF